MILDKSSNSSGNSIVIRATNDTSFVQNQLLQVDHQEEDNKGRNEIDVMCHLSSIEHRGCYAQTILRADRN